MPTISLHGELYDIPSNMSRPYRIQRAETDYGSMGIRTTDYTFHLPDPRVDIEVFESHSGWVDSNKAGYSAPELIAERKAHIADFLAGPGSPGERWERLRSSSVEAEVGDWWRSVVRGYNRAEPVWTAEQQQPGAQHVKTVQQQLIAKHVENLAAGAEQDKPEGQKMPYEFSTGSRVWIRDPNHTNLETKPGAVAGTVVRTKAKAGRVQKTLLCMDESSLLYDAMPGEVGGNHGWWALSSDLRPLRAKDEGLFLGVPQHIGVCVRKEFVHGPILFRPGHLGRLLKYADEGPVVEASVAWFNVEGMSEVLWSKRVGDMDYHKCCFTVPLENLTWCFFNTTSYQVLAFWRASFPSFKEGDFLRYTGRKPIVLSGRKHGYVLTEGVILRHVGYDDQNSCVIGAVAGGMSKEALGMSVKVRKEDVVRFEEPYLAPGSAVEVVAEVVFRKKDLQGRKGTVILPTDGDGDVGVQFSEDIGAGSLDGVGKEGNCLYIPADALKKTAG